MADLILGPMLRYLDETSATVWVETDAPCEVDAVFRIECTKRDEADNRSIRTSLERKLA